ncbi:MAG: hypothetical protein JW875_08175 [Spirochaetales bacterium]|nr:hypothetical protein [Spirochaetales bacterium]HNQ97750.1 hypothetical protein [Treponemataceae bacterium]
MKSLYCDICKNEIENPISERTCFHIKEYDICEACHDALFARLRPTVRSHFPYSSEWYEQQFTALVERSMATSRI